MLLVLIAFLMKFVDISKMQSQQRCPASSIKACNNKSCLQHHQMHAAQMLSGWQQQQHKQQMQSNSSSTSSGCDSGASSSSKENYYALPNKLQQNPQNPKQNSQQFDENITPQQLQQLRYYQQLQRQQLCLLQQQLLQRRRMQQKLREQGVGVAVDRRSIQACTTVPTLTCNQQYLLQLRMQQQQQQQQHQLLPVMPKYANEHNNNNINQFICIESDLLNNNNDNNNNNNNNNNINNNNINDMNNNLNIVNLVGGTGTGVGGNAIESNNFNGFFEVQKFRRGMTEFSTRNDIQKKRKASYSSSQPLQNSPCHQYYNLKTNSSQNHTNNKPHFTQISLKQQQQQQKEQQQILQDRITNFNNNNNLTTTANINFKRNPIASISPTLAAPESQTQSQSQSHQHSPLHYKKPLNSPNNSSFAYAYKQQQQQQQQNHKLLQHMRNCNTSKLQQQPQQQQNFNELLARQQQQRNLLYGGNPEESEAELSEESLKQNVAIVLNNLDRYNNALRSIILNEQVTNNCNNSIYLEDADVDDQKLDGSLLFINNNNHYYYSNNKNNNKNNNNSININNNNIFLHISEGGVSGVAGNMATATTPEADYNSNATTPGSRYDSNMLLQQHINNQQHMVGLSTATPTTNTAFNCGGGGGNSGSCNNALGALGFGGNNLNCSLASEQDFTHDNSDYQWFLDYGYRDGCGGMQRSVLSSLSDSSYNNTLGDLIYYEDIAKNLDANLAEVDMESFRAEDINSLLWQLPSYCQRLANGNQRLQQSLLLQQQLQQDHQQQQHPQHLQLNQQQHQHQLQQQLNRQQTSMTSSSGLIDNSICKSEILFSPVKETHISMVESLDMDNYPDDGDIILTCQANKNNYTIAFEGSVLYSDESFYAEPADIALKNRQNFINLHNNLDEIVEPRPLDVSMSRSDQALTACANNNNNNNNNNKTIQQKNKIMHLQRYPSGNNNTIDGVTMPISNSSSYQLSVRKSNSLPNLYDLNTNILITQCSSSQSSAKNSPHHTPCHQQKQKQIQQHQTTQQQRPKQLNVSQAVSAAALINNGKSLRNMLPMCQIPICCDSINEVNSENCAEHQQEKQVKQQQQQMMLNNKHRHKHHRHCGDLQQQQQQQQQQPNNMSSTYSSSSGSSNTPAFNLVKLFIKQKSNNSSSVEGDALEGGAAVSSNVQNNTCMDVSSGCWPSSDAAGSSSSSSSLDQKLRKKSMNDSGKGSALSKHEEEEETQAVFYDNEVGPQNSTQYRTRPSPLQSSNLRRHTQVSNFLNNNNNNNNNKMSVGSSQQSSSSEQMTQIETNNKGRGSKQQEASSEMITRSMQTSCGTGSLTSTTTTRNGSFNERLRLVPPSFLSKLHKLGEACQAPIYVIYPNYALPDLGFVDTNSNTDKTPDIIYSSFDYRTAVSGKSVETHDKNNQNRFSTNCSEIPQPMDFQHVQDWQSLLTLLPAEHRQRVKHLPQVQQVLKVVEKDIAQRPLFCMTPPIKRSASHLCDCAQYNLPEDVQQNQVGAEVCGSSSSGSSQQPNSSGYRGSSTLLTDSELDRNVMSYDPLKQVYVYQYERLDSGVECPPKTPTPPQAKPRGILRHSPNVGTKRNSMIETAQQHTRLSKLEKRRSLQEPPYAQAEENSSQELAKVFEDEELLYATPPKTRLSRRDLDARARAENFLSSLPRSELKYYAEIAAILESSSSDTQQQQAPTYDAAALKKEVSRVLSQQQKKVSFNEAANEQNILPPTNTHITDAKRFSTPPNSPNISMARLQNGTQSAQRYSTIAKNKPETLDAREQIKTEHNRFKRLQIQWELMSKDSSMLKELALAQQTQSGGSTPTSVPITPKSRIPRPVSYPAGKKINKAQKTEKTPSPKSPANIITKPKTPSSPQIARITTNDGKHAANSSKSPSRLVPPKRYTTPTLATTPPVSGRARTPNSRTPATAPNTPKRQVPSLARASSKVR